MSKIAILLPYKEHYSKKKAGAVSLFVSEVFSKSSYKKNTYIFGSNNPNNLLTKNYINLSSKTQNILQSTSSVYVKEFLKYRKKKLFNY